LKKGPCRPSYIGDTIILLFYIKLIKKGGHTLQILYMDISGYQEAILTGTISNGERGMILFFEPTPKFYQQCDSKEISKKREIREVLY
jgi:hypothetical protein